MSTRSKEDIKRSMPDGDSELEDLAREVEQERMTSIPVAVVMTNMIWTTQTIN